MYCKYFYIHIYLHSLILSQHSCHKSSESIHCLQFSKVLEIVTDVLLKYGRCSIVVSGLFNRGPFPAMELYNYIANLPGSNCQGVRVSWHALFCLSNSMDYQDRNVDSVGLILATSHSLPCNTL